MATTIGLPRGMGRLLGIRTDSTICKVDGRVKEETVLQKKFILNTVLINLTVNYETILTYKSHKNYEDDFLSHFCETLNKGQTSRNVNIFFKIGF